jgi:hypothetical protein
MTDVWHVLALLGVVYGVPAYVLYWNALSKINVLKSRLDVLEDQVHRQGRARRG